MICKVNSVILSSWVYPEMNFSEVYIAYTVPAIKNEVYTIQIFWKYLLVYKKKPENIYMQKCK